MKRHVTCAIALTLFLHGGVSAQLPTAGPEHKRLAYFAGTWNFNGTMKEGPMGPGGPISYKEVCELMDGGFALVCRTEGKGPMGPTRAVGIMSYDAEKKAYSYTAAESNMPVFTATGQVSGKTWTWTTSAMMGTQRVTTRVIVTEGDGKHYDFVMEMSMDGKSFARVVEGKSTKV
jgi:hypothetical protein